MLIILAFGHKKSRGALYVSKIVHKWTGPPLCGGCVPVQGVVPPSALHGIQAPPLPILHLFHFQKAYLEHSFDFFAFLCYDFIK